MAAFGDPSPERTDLDPRLPAPLDRRRSPGIFGLSCWLGWLQKLTPDEHMGYGGVLPFLETLPRKVGRRLPFQPSFAPDPRCGSAATDRD